MPDRLLSVICSRNLMKAVSLLKQIRTSLCDGNIPISHLKLIGDDTERFLDLLTSSKVSDESEGQVMNAILQVRLKELTVSKYNLNQTSLFLNYCKHIPNGIHTLITSILFHLNRRFSLAYLLSAH